VQLLLAKGFDAEGRYFGDGMTLLLWAAKEGHEATVQLLLEKGVNTTAKDKHGRTALHLAIMGDIGDDIEVEENGCYIVPSWCNYRRRWRRAIVQLLLKRGANLEAKCRPLDWTPLLSAAWTGHEAVVRLLLEKGADTSVRDKIGRTPLLLTDR
jgi:ankyrin repeat protein